MKRIILIYGVGAGLAVILSIILGLMLSGGGELPRAQEVLGYLVMLIALSLIFVGIRRYRDRHLGGSIRFTTAMLIGLGIAAVASVVYVAVWEIYLAQTDYAFIESYTHGVIAAQQANGITDAELQTVTEQMETLKTRYTNPFFRLPMTFMQIFPVGLLITLLSSAVLRGRNNATA